MGFRNLRRLQLLMSALRLGERRRLCNLVIPIFDGEDRSSSQPYHAFRVILRWRNAVRNHSPWENKRCQFRQA